MPLLLSIMSGVFVDARVRVCVRVGWECFDWWVESGCVFLCVCVWVASAARIVVVRGVVMCVCVRAMCVCACVLVGNGSIGGLTGVFLCA